MTPEITQEELKRLLHYDPETGVFTWKVNTGKKAMVGQVAGTLTEGRRVVGIHGRPYKAHRLVWLYLHGHMPSNEIYHINGVQDDNRLINLRLAARNEEGKNLYALFPNSISDRQGKTKLALEDLKRFLHYNPETGVFTWIAKAAKNTVAGTVAGRPLSNGYLAISLNKKAYYSHRLAWFYSYGYMPPDQIDHINGVRDDNRLSNLRLANQGENQQNLYLPLSHGTSGYLGVSFDKRSKKWESRIGINHKKRFLGYFSTPEEAHLAYLKAKREMHPFGML